MERARANDATHASPSSSDSSLFDLRAGRPARFIFCATPRAGDERFPPKVFGPVDGDLLCLCTEVFSSSELSSPARARSSASSSLSDIIDRDGVGGIRSFEAALTQCRLQFSAQRESRNRTKGSEFAALVGLDLRRKNKALRGQM